MDEESEDMVIRDKSTVYDNVSELYSSKKFSDVVFIVEEKKIYAHKIVLAIRCPYFEKLLYNGMQETSQSEIPIKDVSSEAFHMILDYIYTGSMIVNHKNLTLMSEVMDLANKYLLEKLKTSLVSKLKRIVSLENFATLLRISEIYQLEDLSNACYNFLDDNADEALISDTFIQLTQTSLIELLKRDSFSAREIDIFKAAVKWSEHENNSDVDNLAIKNIRLSQMTAGEILSIVQPSQLIEYKDILNALNEIIGIKEKTSKSRVRCIVGENVVTSNYKTRAICGNNTESLWNPIGDGNNFAWHLISDENGIVIKLGGLFKLNHIYMKPHDSLQSGFKYSLEISVNQTDWKMVIDYRNYLCRSYQHLYFETEAVGYIRVIGTYTTNQEEKFGLSFLQACYEENIPKIVNGIVRPLSNAATVLNGAAVIEGSNPSSLLSGNSVVSQHTHHHLGSGSITVQLGHPYLISEIKLLLYPADTYYRYYVETSVDKTNWDMAIDCSDKNCRSLQNIVIPEREVIFIRIVGCRNNNSSHNYHSASSYFYCTYFECR